MGSFECLIDPDAMKSAIEAIAEIAEVPITDPPHPISTTIRETIIIPLKAYLAREHRATDGKGHAGTEIAIAFMMAAEDISEKLHRQNGFVFFEHIDLLEKRWKAFIEMAGWTARGYAKAMLPLVARDAKAQIGRCEGGLNRWQSVAEDLEERNQYIADKALELIQEGRRRDCVSILSQRTGLSPRQIRNILKSYQISTVQNKRK